MPIMDTLYSNGVQDFQLPAVTAMPRSRSHRTSSSSRPERRPRRHHKVESGSTSSCSSSNGESQAKLADLFIETKIEMMRMVEDDLKLKLDVRQMKECFYNLLKNFEAFENKGSDQPEVVTALRRQDRMRHSSRRPQIHRRLSRASSDALQESSASAMCPNNTRTSSTAWAAASSNIIDDSIMSDVIGTSRVNDLSAITQCSNTTYREQCSQSRIMDVAGPLSSTIRYPQYSTPEKKRPHPEDAISPIAGRVQDLHTASAKAQEEVASANTENGHHRRRLMYDHRSASTGANRNTPQRSAPTPAAALVLRAGGSDSDATPVAVRAATRLPVQDADGSDSGMYGSDTPSTLGRDNSAANRRSKHFRSTDDLSLEVVTPMSTHHFMESLKALDGRLRRQTAQPCLSQELRSPVGLSETDFLDASSLLDGTMVDLQCSTNATRASVANFSALSASPSSEESASPGAESSYKESDATASSPPAMSGRTLSRKQQESRDQRYHSRQMAALSTYTSGTSTVSSCGGFLAPSNSPNATVDSAPTTSSSKLRAERTSSSSGSRVSRASSSRDQRRNVKDAYLGARPPCIGSDILFMGASRPPTAPAPRAAMSDPETSRVGRRDVGVTRHTTVYAYSRTARREAQQSGASSESGSNYSSDQSNISGPLKEPVVGCIRISGTPTKARGVRRSLSKRIKKLGKKIMKTNSRSKADAQHSI